MGKPSAPSPPNPRDTASAQTGTNVSTALANNIMGMVNQNTPYGSLSYEQTGQYDWTDPYTNKSYTVPTYTSTVSLTPEQQGILDSNLATQGNLSDLAQNRSGFLNEYMSEAPPDTEAREEIINLKMDGQELF